MGDDKYTIELDNYLLYMSGFYIPYWLIIDCCGVAELVGPYCMWPKTEPRIFEVSYEKQS